MTREQRRQHLVIWVILAATIITVLISSLMVRIDPGRRELGAGSGSDSHTFPRTPGASP